MASGEEEGAEIYQPPCRLPEKGWWFPPTVFTNVAQSYRIAQEEIFGPVLSMLTFRTPDEAVEKANNTPYGLSAGVWTEKGSRILSMAQRLRAGVIWANTYNRFDPASPFGGYKESGFGRGGRPAQARPVPGVRRVSRLPVKKTYKLYLGGAFPRSESGRTYEVEGANVALASRKDVRDAVRARAGRLARSGRDDCLQPRPGPVRVAEMMEGRRAEFAELTGDEAEVNAAIDRWVWYAGWADKLAQVLGTSNPVAGPYFNFTFRSPRVVGIVAPEEPPLAGLVSRLAPAVVGGNVAVVLASEHRPLRPCDAGRGACDLGRPRRRRQRPHGTQAELAPCSPGTWT